MRRSTVLGVVVALGLLAVGLTGASIAGAAKPERGPLVTEPTVLGPGQACAFDVEISQAPGGNYTETFFSDRYVVTGSGGDRVRRLPNGPSLTLPTSGKVTVSDLANGDQRLQASGRTVFYFYEGDQGPFGEVGPDGALYYIVGHVDEVLDPETDFTVTSFKWSGTATELCSRID